MRDRISFSVTKDKLLSSVPKLDISQILIHDYNISPSKYMYVIIQRENQLILERMLWGLIPNTSKDGSNNGNLYKVSSKHVSSKPSFRIPFRTRRCIVVYDHYYVWYKDQPYRISCSKGQLLFAAGVWDEWRNDFERKSSFSIVTTPSRGSLVAISEQIPFLLNIKDFNFWLNENKVSDLNHFLESPSTISLNYFETTDRIKDPNYNNIDLLAPVVKSHTLFD